MSISLQAAILDIAVSQVGVREGVSNNTGADIIKYQRATWLAPAAWPWCAAFCSWVLQEALKRTYGVTPPFKHCQDASAYGWETWALKHITGGKLRGFQLLTEDKPALPGDFVTFDFSHIGIVVNDIGATIQTIEGNTNGKGERDSITGDGVWRKTRARSLVKSFIRLPNTPPK